MLKEPMDKTNGSSMLFKMRHDVENLKRDRESIADAIDHLAAEIKNLGDKLDRVVPIKIVYLIFILVFGLNFGIEVLKSFFKVVILP